MATRCFSEIKKCVLKIQPGLKLIIFFGAPILFVSWLSRWNNNRLFQFKEGWYGNWIDPSFTIITLIVTTIFAIIANAENWNNKLPKRLTIHFVLPPESGQKDLKIIFTCLEAYLSGESDIRQWAQQIGRQKFGRDLDFFPYITQVDPVISYSNSLKDYKLYEVFIFLRKKPLTINELQYTVWDDNEDDSAENSEYLFTDCPVFTKTLLEQNKKRKKRKEKFANPTHHLPPTSRKEFLSYQSKTT